MDPQPASGVSLRDLRVRYGPVLALDGVSLDVEKGEFLVLVGPSGSGKSTLLEALSGLQALETGRVFIAGRDVTRVEPGQRNIGMVFQSFALYPTMSAARNITFGMRMRGASRAVSASRLAEVARLLDIEDLLSRKPAQLSGGQRQRVAIARALVRDPDVFALDEPLSSLDAALRVRLRSDLKTLHRTLGTTTIYVTHDQIEAMTLATRVAVLDRGRILQVGPPDDVYARPEDLFVATFMGSPPMNLIEGRLELGGGVPTFECPGAFQLSLDGYGWKTRPKAGRPVLLGVRPEQVRCPVGEDRPAIQMVVTGLERAGADTFVDLALGGITLKCRVSTDDDLRPGETMRVEIDRRLVSVFCPASGQRL